MPRQTMTETNPKLEGVFSLFDNTERKTILKKYILFIGVIEIIILLFCWFYQLGSQEYDRFGAIHTPFPWRMYFLISFTTPVAITFLLGIFIVAFNQYFYNYTPYQAPNHQENQKISKISSIIDGIFNIPFLISLLLLGLSAGIIYRIEDVFYLLSRIGEKTAQWVMIILCAGLGFSAIYGLTWMILKYRLNKTSMEYKYRNDVMNRLGLVILDKNTIFDHKGQLIYQKNGQSSKDIILLPNQSEQNDVTVGTIHSKPSQT